MPRKSMEPDVLRYIEANPLCTTAEIEAVLFEMLDIMQDRASMDESLVYDLGRQYTTSGNPEPLTLDSGDVLLTTEDDE